MSILIKGMEMLKDCSACKLWSICECMRDYPDWECDQCGMGVGLDDVRNYCPNCGARMEESDETH